MKNTKIPIEGFLPLPVKDRIRSLRKARGWSQTEFAEAIGVTQSLVSLWERGDSRPTASALVKIAEFADDAQRALWVTEAGLSRMAVAEDEDGVRRVPVLKDAAAAGTPRAVDPSNVEYYVALPTAWLPRNGKLVALHVAGDSMAPLVNDGYIVIVNTAQRVADVLLGHMVAARDGEGGVTIKWLRRDEGHYFLIPQNTSERHPIRMLRDEGNWSIVGEVVKIIGDPPAPKRK